MLPTHGSSSWGNPNSQFCELKKDAAPRECPDFGTKNVTVAWVGMGMFLIYIWPVAEISASKSKMPSVSHTASPPEIPRGPAIFPVGRQQFLRSLSSPLFWGTIDRCPSSVLSSKHLCIDCWTRPTRAVTLRVPVLEKWSGQDVDFLLVLSLSITSHPRHPGQPTSPLVVQFVFYFSL